MVTTDAQRGREQGHGRCWQNKGTDAVAVDRDARRGREEDRRPEGIRATSVGHACGHGDVKVRGGERRDT